MSKARAPVARRIVSLLTPSPPPTPSPPSRSSLDDCAATLDGTTISLKPLSSNAAGTKLKLASDKEAVALNGRLQKLCVAPAPPPAADPQPAVPAGDEAGESTPRKLSVDSQKWLADNVGEDWGKIERPKMAMMTAELGGPAVELGAPTGDKRSSYRPPDSRNETERPKRSSLSLAQAAM